MTAPLIIKHADGAQPAVHALAAFLHQRTADDALRSDWVLVQSRPMAQWLTLEVARSTGACAGVDWLLPTRFLDRVLTATGVTTHDRSDPWRRDILVWRILDALPRLPATPAGRYAATSDLQAWQLAQRIADLFDTWQLTRSDWLNAWEQGVTPAGSEDKPDAAWLSALWQFLVADQTAGPTRAARLHEAIARLHRGAVTGLMPRSVGAVLTGPLPEIFLSLLEALAAHLGSGFAIVIAPSIHEHSRARSPARAAAHGGEVEGHRLLATLGLQGRRWIRRLEERPVWEPQPVDGWSVRQATPTTLLGALQLQIAQHAEPGTGARLPTWDAARDHSLRVEHCPGPLREAEVVRDALLQAFADLPGLTPGDILILVPDLALYAPVLAAALESGRSGHRLATVVSGISVADSDPAARAFLAVIQAVSGDTARSAMFALMDLDPVRSRMHLDQADIERLRQILDRAGVSCDSDGTARAQRLGLPSASATAWAPGTWRHALDRLLAGYALGDTVALADGTLPEAGATAPDAELLGRWATWWEDFATVAAAWNTPRDAAQWGAFLRDAVERLLGDDDGNLSLQSVQTAINGFADAGRWHRDMVPSGVALDALVGSLAHEAQLAPGLDGRIVVSGLAPFRAIPARVVVLMGMADGSFPRRTRPTAFDPTQAELRPGERDPRADDRQLFLDAILAAGDRLIITAPAATDRGDRSEAAPLSSCVEELLDAATDALPVGVSRDALIQSAPLQPFSARYLDGSRAVWDQHTLDLALQITRGAPPNAPMQVPFLVGALAHYAAPLPTTPLVTLTFNELSRFWRNPAAAWLASALDLHDDEDDTEPGDEDPLTLPARTTASVLRDLVLAELAGIGASHAVARRAATGHFPLGAAGAIQRRQLQSEAHDILHRVGFAPGQSTAISLDLLLDLPTAIGGVRQVQLIGEIPGRMDGALLATWTTASKLHAPQRVEMRLRQLAAAATCATAVGCRVSARENDVTLKPLAANPRHALATLCGKLLLGRSEPLPFLPATAYAAHKAQDPAAGLRVWGGDDEQSQTDYRRDERDERGFRLLWRGCSPDDIPGCWLCGEEIWGLLESDVEAPPPADKPARKSRASGAGKTS